MLNIGSGITRIHPKILNLEINSGHNVDIVASADNIPLQHSSVDLVVSQEVLEHVPSPSDVLLEIYRVLKPGGCLYLQIPWVFGYHGCPNDYWRFSRDGIVQLVEDSGFCIQNLSITVGPFTGFYRVAVEAFAILGSLFSSAYKAFKLFSAIIFSPVKLLDSFSLKSSQAHRLAGGFVWWPSKKLMNNILITSAGRRFELVMLWKASAQNLLGSDVKVFATDLAPELSPACHAADQCFEIVRCTDQVILYCFLNYALSIM